MGKTRLSKLKAGAKNGSIGIGLERVSRPRTHRALNLVRLSREERGGPPLSLMRPHLGKGIPVRDPTGEVKMYIHFPKRKRISALVRDRVRWTFNLSPSL